jgi:hypothetical protein
MPVHRVGFVSIYVDGSPVHCNKFLTYFLRFGTLCCCNPCQYIFFQPMSIHLLSTHVNSFFSNPCQFTSFQPLSNPSSLQPMSHPRFRHTLETRAMSLSVIEGTSTWPAAFTTGSSVSMSVKAASWDSGRGLPVEDWSSLRHLGGCFRAPANHTGITASQRSLH